jgi:hypothetical protein
MHELLSYLSMNYKITTSKSEVHSYSFPLHSIVPHHVTSILQSRVEVTHMKAIHFYLKLAVEYLSSILIYRHTVMCHSD